MTLRMLRFGALTLAVAAVACTGTISGPDGSGVGSGNGTPGTVNGGNGQPGGPNGSAGGGNSTDPGGAVVTTPAKLNLTGSPAYYRVVRLTNDQWTNSVQKVLALATPPDNAMSFQDGVSGLNDFTNNENAVGNIDSRSWGDFQDAAEALADKVTNDATLLSKIYSGTDAAGFISTVGRRFYRRPLSATETSAYQTLFTSGASLSGSRTAFAKGASLVLRAMMQSPYFLYRTELSAAGAPLSGYEMAAKLALWLRNVTPDDALLDSAAGPGKLDTADGAVALAKTMLDEPAAMPVMRNFHRQYLKFDKFSNLSKVGVANYDPAINAELSEASYLFFDKIFSKGLGLRDVFLSTSGFVGPKMAALYGNGITSPASGYSEQDLGAKRVGYFLQLPFLVLYAHNADPDSIHRGVSMNLDVLCATLGPPAAMIPPLVPLEAGMTNRVRVDKTTAGCGQQCHNAMINPLGFSFEHFDGMGQFRDTETNAIDMKQLPIDSSGKYAFTDGEKSYDDAQALMQVLANSEQAHLCYSKKLASYGLQRDVIDADMDMIKELAKTSMTTGGSVKQVMLDLVKQNAFRTHSGGAK